MPCAWPVTEDMKSPDHFPLAVGDIDSVLYVGKPGHYHHLEDDVIQGGPLPYTKGAVAVPTGPGLGVTVDRAVLNAHRIAA